MSAGQINGNFAVWGRATRIRNASSTATTCRRRTATALPTVPARSSYSPSVNPYGTVYYLRSTQGCGSRWSS